ncbi:MAG TPA: alpha/beta fold hydrolase [Myxococcales bacterium]|nr:alpha/beta fold hydrolase [Myxococcales bacterium]
MHLLLGLLLAVAPPPETPASGVEGMQPAPGVPSLMQSGLPGVPSELRARTAQFQNARAALLADVSSDGGALLISTRFASTAQLHLVETPLGMRTQITFGEEPVNQARFQPGDTQTVWYLQDKGGGEFFQLYRLDRRTGRSQLLTDGKSRHGALTLSRDGKRLAYSGTQRNGKDTDVYVADTASPQKARRVTEAEGTWEPVEFSPDGARLLVLHERSIQDADLYALEVGSGKLAQLTPKEGKASVLGARWSSDGKGVYVITDRWSDFNQLYLLDKAGKHTPLSADLKWDVENLAVADDGSRVAFDINEDGASRLYVLDRHGRAQQIALPGNVVISKLEFPRRRSDMLAVNFQTATQPSDVYEVDLRGVRVVRWTRSEVGGLDPSRFVDAQLVKYPAGGGAGMMPAFLYKPRNVAGKVPVVVIWHGGPESQSRPTFSSFVQLMASELGIAVLMPNVRGSFGYGKAYLAADDGPKREQALTDIGATLDFVEQQQDLDASRIGVYGGSYGGYMTLSAAAFYSGRIRAAVDVVGISNLVTFLENTQAYRRDLRRAEYGDERDPAVRAVQERISPLLSVQKIDAELFVQQGYNDPRVPRSEAEQIVKAVRARGKDVWYLLGMNEGHGFAKKENRDYAVAATALFFQQKLLEPIKTN